MNYLPLCDIYLPLDKVRQCDYVMQYIKIWICQFIAYVIQLLSSDMWYNICMVWNEGDVKGWYEVEIIYIYG